jgi:hypothetical protein
MQRRDLLTLGVAGAASVGAASLLGTWPANAGTMKPLWTAPFAVAYANSTGHAAAAR